MTPGLAGLGFGSGTTGKLGRACHRCMGGAWHWGAWCGALGGLLHFRGGGVLFGGTLK